MFSVYEAFVFVNIYITKIIGEHLRITDARSLVSQQHTLLISVISLCPFGGGSDCVIGLRQCFVNDGTDPEQGMGRWVMGQMGHENRMGHMGHGSLGVDP